MQRLPAYPFILPAACAVLAASLTVAFWWWMGQPVAMPPSPLSANEKIPCVSYAPFRGEQTPLDPATRIPAAQIDEDFAVLKLRTGCVRTYSIEHALGQIAGLARKHGLKVMQGIWLSSNPVSNRREIDGVVNLVRQFPDVISAVIVGNEVLLRGEMSGADLAAVIGDVKARVSVPVTYADVWEFWLRHREVYEAVDFVTVHILPYWEDFPVAARDAAAHVDSIRRKMAAAFPGKDILIGETGFPSQGRMRAGALPSPANQARALHEVLALARRDGLRINLIEAFDQPWKRGLEGTVGGFWGLLDAYHRGVKFAWGEPVSNHPAWARQAIGGVALVVAIALAAMVAARRNRPSPAAWAGVFVCAATAGLMVPLAIEKIPLESFTAGGWVRSLAMGLVAIAAPLVVSAALTAGAAIPSFAQLLARRGERLRDPLPLALGLVLIAATVLAVHVALGQVFDPRYREFHYAPLSAAIGPFAVLALRSPRGARARPAAETAAAGILLLSAVYIAFNESFANWQALWLCGLLVALALILWRARAAPG